MPRKSFTTIDSTKCRGVIQVMTNKWWWCEDGDPKKAVVYRGYSPQCNSDKRIAEKIGAPYDGCRLVYVEEGYMPVDTSEEQSNDH